MHVSDEAAGIIKSLLARRSDVVGMRLAAKETDFQIVPSFGYEIKGEEQPKDERYEVDGEPPPAVSSRCKCSW